MDAKWIVIILLAAAVVFLFFRGESIRKSAKELHDWNVKTQKWAKVVNDDFWALRKEVCDKHPGICTDGDKKTNPPDPPPEFP